MFYENIFKSILYSIGDDDNVKRLKYKLNVQITGVGADARGYRFINNWRPSKAQTYTKQHTKTVNTKTKQNTKFNSTVQCNTSWYCMYSFLHGLFLQLLVLFGFFPTAPGFVRF